MTKRWSSTRSDLTKTKRQAMTNTPAWTKDWKWWCEACGTLTNDGECDCTRFEETVHSQRLRRVAGIEWNGPDKERK